MRSELLSLRDQRQSALLELGSLAAQHPGYWKANPDLYVDEWQNPYSTPEGQPFLWTRGRQVGGKSLTWGGITLRLSDAEFQAAEHDSHGRPWPIRHADLAPFYEQLETLLNSRLKELKNERAEVELLLSAARRCEARGIDVKAQALLDTIGQLQREENEPALKVLLFTEFVPTQTMLAEVLEQRGYPVVLLNGSMNLEERKSAQRAFANEAQILISTDAGGHWWEVAVPEVSVRPQVNEAREKYEAALAKQRVGD